MVKDPKKVKSGKASKAAGGRFELRVRYDLERKGWIVAKWSNNVEWGYFEDYAKFVSRKWKDLTLQNGDHYPGPVARMVKVKNKFLGPGRPMMLGAGFPDFISFKRHDNYENLAITNVDEEETYEPICLIGVESKMNGLLGTEEKEKCRWLLRNKIFSKILIAKKGEKRGEIVYEDFLEIESRMRKI